MSTEWPTLKPMFTVNDIVRLTGRSRRTIIRWLERTPGVILLFDHPERMHKRRYRTFRVPREVLEGVVRNRGTALSIECGMRVEKQYRGHKIQATSFKLRSGDYTVHYNVVTHTKRHSDDSYIQSGKVFGSEQEALDAGIKMGEQAVDGG